jgi:N-acetylglutamate synthase-like GNAT family acetyltransferase
MKRQHATIVNGTVSIRRATREDINPLVKAGFPFGQIALTDAIAKGFTQTVGLAPPKAALVAQHIQQKRVIGVLSLHEHTPSLYSIKNVFTDSNFRGMGVASGLISYALSLAKERGAKKVYLNPNTNIPYLTKFYESLGFNLIVDTSIVWGGGYVAEWQNKDYSSLCQLVNPGENINLLFNIYRQCMGQKWVDFFETSAKNVANGFSQDFRRFFSKAALIGESGDSFSMIFKRPLYKIASIELYPSSDSSIPSIIDAMFKILSGKGTKYVNIKVFNINNDDCFNLLKELEFYPFQARVLGKSL